MSTKKYWWWIILVAGLLFLVGAGVVIARYFNQPEKSLPVVAIDQSINSSTTPITDSLPQFRSQAECESQTGRSCSPSICDFIVKEGDCDGVGAGKVWKPDYKVVTLEVGAPFSSSLVVIFESGYSYYRVDWPKDRQVLQRKNLSEVSVKRLFDLIMATKFSEWPVSGTNPPRRDLPADGYSYTITVAIPKSGQSPEYQRVSCYQFNCEDRFIKLKNQIIDLWGGEVLEIGV